MVWPVAGELPGGCLHLDRFNAKGNTLEDRFTRRMWWILGGDKSQPVKWQEALEMIDALNLRQAEGFDNWRLPNIRELESLVDLVRNSPALPVVLFEHRHTNFSDVQSICFLVYQKSTILSLQHPKYLIPTFMAPEKKNCPILLVLRPGCCVAPSGEYARYSPLEAPCIRTEIRRNMG